MSRCFHYAVLERGPTQLNIPRDMFYGDLTTAIPEPTPVERSAGGPAALAQAAQLLAAARNPVIISGGGVVMAGGVDQVVELAETCQVRGGYYALKSPLDQYPPLRRCQWCPPTYITTPSQQTTCCGWARWATRAPRQP